LQNSIVQLLQYKTKGIILKKKETLNSQNYGKKKAHQ